MNNDSGRINFTVGLDNTRLQQDAAEARRILESIGNSTKSESEKMKSAFDGVGKTIVGVFGVAQATNFAKALVKVRGEIESLERSFETLAGKATGGKLFAEIKDFAVNTPMAMQELAKGAQTLLAFNIAAEDVMPILRSIGDISLGNADKFNHLVLAFAQTSSAGKLMGQDLLQMINAGFNPLSIISEQTGKSIGVLREEMSNGAISAEMVKKAFMDATAEGGKFNGMLESQSQTVRGAMSNLEDSYREMLNTIGQQSQGVIMGAIGAAKSLVENYEKVGRIIAELVAAFGVYKAALIALTAAKAVQTQVNAGWTISEIAHYNALLLVEKAQKLLNATILKNPYVLAAAAVAALAYGIYKLVTHQTDAEKAQAKLNETTKEFNKDVASERVQIDSLFARLKAAKEGTDEYKTAKQAILNQYGDYLKGLSKEIQSLQDVEGAYRAVTQAAQDAARARALERATADAADTYAAKEAEGKDEVMELLQEKFGGQTGSDGISLAQTYYWKIVPVLEGKAEITDEVQQIISQFDERKLRIVGTDFRGNPQWDYVNTNPLQDDISSVNRARGIYNNTVQQANNLFGFNPNQQPESEGEGKAEVVKNKKYWEDYKKEQQGLLDAMTEVQLQTEEARQIRANIANAQRHIDSYSVSKTTKQGEQANTEAVNAAERTQRINDYTASVTEAVEQSKFDIEQAEIDALEDSYEKQSRQINLNYDRLKAENAQRKNEWLENLRDKEELEWQNENPDWKKQGLTFDRSSVTEADLSEDELAVLQMYEDMENDYKRKENEKLLKELLDKYATYEEQRNEITKRFEDERNQLYELNEDGSYKTDDKGNRVLREGVEQGNVDELNRQEEEALAAIDEQFAAREETYHAWCEMLTSMTLDQLLAVLNKAEEELAAVEASGQGGQKLATAKAKVATAKEKVDQKKAQTDVSPDKRSIKEWNDLRGALEDCINSFEEVGDAVGGVAGEIISTTGNIMGSTLSMINGIVQLVQMSSSSMQATAIAGSTAIQTVEKASVILAVISAALQIAMQIAQLFNNDEEKQEEIERLQGRIDQLQWELDNADIVALRENAFNSLERVRQVTAEVTMELVSQRIEVGNTAGAWKLLFGGAVNDADAMKESVERLATAYGNVAYKADKALGEERFKSSKDQLKNIAEQQMLIQEQINQENSKKDTDHGKIEEWEQQIEELGAEAVQIINDMVEEIIGGSSTEIAEQLGEAFFEAFEAGEDAAKAWGDAVNDIVADILKRMLVQQFLEQPLGDIFNRYKQKWFPNGEFAGMDVVIGSMTSFANDLNGTLDIFEQMMGELPDELKQYLQGEIDATREASEKGIATASQESVDELNGRMTAVQGHTYSIMESTKILVQTAGLILQSVVNIENNTDRMDTRMKNIEDDISDVKDTVNDIALKGIKIR